MFSTLSVINLRDTNKMSTQPTRTLPDRNVNSHFKRKRGRPESMCDDVVVVMSEDDVDVLTLLEVGNVLASHRCSKNGYQSIRAFIYFFNKNALATGKIVSRLNYFWCQTYSIFCHDNLNSINVVHINLTHHPIRFMPFLYLKKLLPLFL